MSDLALEIKDLPESVQIIYVIMVFGISALVLYGIYKLICKIIE